MNVRIPRLLLLALLSVAWPALAQFTFAPLKTFGTGGWLAPKGYNGSTYSFLTTGDTERGLAWGNHHLYLVSRNGGDFIRILDDQTGQDLGALNLGTNLVGGGTFDINMVAVGGDGAIYVGNLATGPVSFSVYRWADDVPATLPTVAYSGVPLAGARVGDSLAAIGSGALTLLAAGFHNTPAVTGDSGYAIIAPRTGSATAVGFSAIPPAAGDFRVAIGFTDSTHVIGTPGGGSGLRYTSFSGAAGTLLASPALASTDERALSFAIVGGFPLLAVISTADSHVSLYNLADPANPVLIAQANATSGTLPTDSHNTGAVAWGNLNGNRANLYAMATDCGIQAFIVTVPLPNPAAIANEPSSQTVMELFPATFTVGASGNPAPTYQWYRGNAALAGATNASYTLPAAAYTDNGAQFQVVAQNVVSNVTYAVTSSVVTLTVLADTNPPVLLGAQALGLTQVQVQLSKRITPASATNLANYVLSSTNGNPAVVGATLEGTQTNVLLVVSSLTNGTFYTLTVNNLAAQTAAGTLIAPNSQAGFVALLYHPVAIGNPALPGTLYGIPNGVGVTSGGADIGGTTDQFLFAYQQWTGDFDLSLNLAGLSLSDVFAKAGLLARETLDPGSRFAAALATPSMMGLFFESRDPAGSAASTQGRFPANFPNTWLRLRRAGNTFSGFGSYDGQVWTTLGSATIALPAQIYLGLALTSHNTNQLAAARFVGITNTPASAVTGLIKNPHEPLGVSSRKTPVVISEILYRPAPRTDGLRLEFVELYNSNPWFQDLSGYQLTGNSLSYTFPAGTVMPGGSFLVVAAAPADVQSTYGITNVVGPYIGGLRRSDTLQLLDEVGAVLLTIPYSNLSPWPVAADGTGHSLVLARPTYGEGDPRAWDISDVVGGSPGATESFRPSPLRDVLVNEVLAPSEDPSVPPFVELYNHSNQTNDLSGCILTDDPATNKCVLPAGTMIAPGGFLAFTLSTLGFAPNSAGGTVFFLKPDGSRVLDAVAVPPQADGVSYGRSPDGADAFYPLSASTPGANNGQIWVGDIVLNELMYAPISGDDDDQFIELYNKGTNAVSLAGWQFVSGVSFVFPDNVTMTPDSYLVIGRNQTNLLAKYPNLSSSNTLGNYGGKLSHKGERLALAMPRLLPVQGPGGPTTNTVYVVEDEVTYGTGGRWGQWSHAGGSSLELINPNSNHRLAYNWADSDETSKSVWTNFEFTGVLDLGANYNGSPINLVQLGLLDVGECLVDDIEVRPGGPNGTNLVANGEFEAGLANWTAQGDHLRSTLETAAGLGGYQSGQSMHLRSSDGMWTLADYLQGALTPATLGSGQTATMRLKARWLHGWPEVLMRLRGNWLEVTGKMPVPANLGSPGQRNSRYQASPAPAIYEVAHSPAIPPANQPLVVSARFHDLNRFQPSLRYRIDTGVNPSRAYTSVPMVDDGTGGDSLAGDGIYSATIPAQPAGTVVAFLVQARDASGATSIFPQDYTNTAGLPRECVAAFGDPIPPGSFSHHHLFITQNWAQRWAQWGGVSHEYYDGTWVDGGGRIVYDMLGRYAGSPYHQYLGSPVSTVGGMHWLMPEDDQVFGTATFNKQHVPGNGPLDDDTIQREQASFWMARQLGLPVLNRRYYFYFVNGVRHAPLMEDSQVPGAEMLKEYWPNDNNGILYKNNAWFEGDVSLQSSGYMNVNNMSFCVLGRFTTTLDGVPNQYKLARYRWMWWIRQYANSANDFSQLYALIDAANTPTATPAYYANMESQIDTEEWLRLSAVEHATGDLDSFFTLVHWNMYCYKPTTGKWTALKWDWNITLGAGTSPGWGPGGSQLFVFSTSNPSQYGGYDPLMTAFHAYPPYRRAYLRAFQEIAQVAMNNAAINPLLDAKYAAFVANGLATTPYNGLLVKDPAAPGGLESWIGTMHNSLLAALSSQGVSGVSFAINSSVVSNNVVLVSGTAPVSVKTIWFNGVEWPVTWTTVTTWSVTVPLSPGTNQFGVVGVDLHGQPVADATGGLAVVYGGVAPAPAGQVVINEIMYRPAVPGADYIELYNSSPTLSFDLSGWQLNGLGYGFPAGSLLAPNGYLLLAGNRSAFASAYGGRMPLFDVYPGALSSGGQTLALVAPSPNRAAGLPVAEVQYSSQAPWPAQANTPGSSLQLIDSRQDNWRVGNWAASLPTAANPTNAQWVYVTATGTASSSRLNIYAHGPGLAYVDDLKLVAGTVPESGANLVSDGDFESPLASNWNLGPDFTSSGLVSSPVHSGSSSLQVVAVGVGNSGGDAIYQDINPALSTGQVYTLSFWYWQTTNPNAPVLSVELSGAGLSSGPIYTGVSGAAQVFAAATPGAANGDAAALAPFSPLWINEVQADNLSGLTNRLGQRSGWLELFNPSTNAVDLAGLYLSTNYGSLTVWSFPAGAAVQPGEFKVVFADGQPALSTTNELHTSLVLNRGSGSLALSRVSNGRVEVLDYIDYTNLAPDHSYGSMPDGQSFDRREFAYPTPGAPNQATNPPSFIPYRTVGEVYTQDFDALPNPGTASVNSANPVTIAGITYSLANPFDFAAPALSSGSSGGLGLNSMAGWYGRGALAARFGAADGDQTTGGVVSFGPPNDPNRALGLLATSGTGPTAFGAKFINQTDRTLNYINLQLIGELWRQSDLPKSIEFSYLVDPTASAPFSTDSPRLISSLEVGFPASAAAVGGLAVDGTATLNQTNLSVANQPITEWPPGAALWLVWQMTDATGKAQGLAVDNLRFSASDQPATLSGPALAARISGPSLVLTWASLPGASYQLEYTKDLASGAWVPLGGTLTGTGGPLSITNGIYSSQEQFYRISALP